MRRVLLVPAGFLGLFFAYPLAATLAEAASGSAWAWLIDDYARSRMLAAAWQATLSTGLTLACAVPLAWLYHTRGFTWGKAAFALHAAPFVLPVFVVVGAAREVLGPSGWAGQLGWNGLAALGPLGVVVLAHAYYNYGFAARILHTALERRPWRLEEAARALGATPSQAFRRVTLPLIAPAIGSVALLVWLFSYTSFGVVLLLGQGQVATPETMMYQQLAGAFPRLDRAAAIGVTQLAINALLIFAYLRLRHRIQWHSERPRPAPPAGPTSQALAIGGLVLAMLPILAVLSGGFRVGGEWSLEAWRALLDLSHPDHLAGFALGPVILRTLLYAFASCVISVGLASTLGLALRGLGKLRGAAEMLAAVPLGTSSVLLGYGYLLAFGAGSWLDLRGQWVAIVIVHALIGFPFVARVLLPAIDNIDRRMEEAALVLGANRWQIVGRVFVPALRAPLIASAGFAAAMSIGDFGASLLLARRDTMGLAVWISQHDVPFRAIMHSQSIALTAILMILAAGAYLLVERFRDSEMA